VLLTQWAANASSLRPPLPAAECQYSISFVGTAHGKRRAWVDALRQRGINVVCFGHGWQRGPVSAEEIPRIIRNSVISLNFANSPWVWDGILPRQVNQIKARTFEVPGAGGFLLTEWANGLECYYTPGHEIGVFHNLEELADKIRHYLAYPAERDAIAWAGYRRTCAEHTYDKRLTEVLDFGLRQRETHFLRRGVLAAGRIDWNRFEESAERHRISRKLQVLRHLLVATCSVAWGPVRGPRAARRLVFELSWRLASANTYSAAGWPGRMFYRES
jgi:spore maturation protein CgeB